MSGFRTWLEQVDPEVRRQRTTVLLLVGMVAVACYGVYVFGYPWTQLQECTVKGGRYHHLSSESICLSSMGPITLRSKIRLPRL